MISRLILEVLDQCPSYLFDPSNLWNLRRSLQAPEYSDSNPRLPCGLLSDILNQCSDSEIYIVLDRIDACDCMAAVFIERLLELVVECKATVKVFAVAGPLGNFDVGDITSVTEGECFRVLRMDQRIKKRSSQAQ